MTGTLARVSTGDEGPRYHPPVSSGQYAQYPQNPYGPNSTGNPYPYTPYAQAPVPAAPPQPARRPGTVVGGYVLLLLAALPFLVLGVLGAFVTITRDMFPAELGLDALLTQYNVGFDQFVQALHLLMALMAVLALVYVALASAAFAGRRWGRIAVTVLTALFDLFLLLNIGGGGAAGLVFVAPLLVSVAGVVLLHVRPSAAWFAAR